MIPEGITRSRTSRFNVARPPTTETRPSRGPWLAIGLCCPDGSSLTTASCVPLNPSPLLWFRGGGCCTKGKRLKVGIRRVPSYSAGLCSRAASHTPATRESAIDCFFLFGISLHPGVTGSAPYWKFRGCRVHSFPSPQELLRPASWLASFRGRLHSSLCRRGRPQSASNMTTWINSQFPRPDFHRRVQRHYGLQDTGIPPGIPPLTPQVTCRRGTSERELSETNTTPPVRCMPGSVGDFVTSIRTACSLGLAWPGLTAPPVPAHPFGRSVEHPG